MASNRRIFPGCPPASQVGMISLSVFPGLRLGSESVPIYEMQAPTGTAAALGFQAVAPGVYFHLAGKVDSEGSYELVARAPDVSNKFPIAGARVTLWGNPLAAEHDATRGKCAYVTSTCPVSEQVSPRPYVTLPSQCSSDLEGEANAASWSNPGATVGRRFTVTDLAGNVQPNADCGSLAFNPTITAQPSTHITDSPAGLSVNLHQPQNEDVNGRATATLKDVKVELPKGVVVNPSGGNGLEACSEQDIGRLTLQPLRFSESPQSCPNAAKIATVEVRTPLLGHSLPGSVYLAEPFANPFHSLLAIYLAIEDEQSGIIAKLGGRVEADASSGQVTATFEENPELPIEDISVKFFSGDRAALKTGLSCGSFETVGQLTPWSAPQAPDVRTTDSFPVDGTPGGKPCPSTDGDAPAEARLVAGTLDPQAGSYSPLVFKASRDDGSQPLSAIEATLPPGLIGRLAGIPYCWSQTSPRRARGTRPTTGSSSFRIPPVPQHPKLALWMLRPAPATHRSL